MDTRLENLYITIVDSPRTKYFAVSDGEVEALAEIADNNLHNIQNALNKALQNYKDKIKRMTETTEGSHLEE